MFFLAMHDVSRVWDVFLMKDHKISAWKVTKFTRSELQLEGRVRNPGENSQLIGDPSLREEVSPIFPEKLERGRELCSQGSAIQVIFRIRSIFLHKSFLYIFK